MADIDLTVYDVVKAGLDLTANATTVVATTNNYFFLNSGKEILYVNNTTGSTCVVEITRTGQVDGASPAARSVSVATAKEFAIGPFEPSDFNDGNGKVKLVFDQAVDAVIARVQKA